jgi:hypothetical protein
MKMTARPRSIVHSDSDGRCLWPAKSRSVLDTGDHIDAHMTADPFTTSKLTVARAPDGARLNRTRNRVIIRLEITGPCWFAGTNSNGCGKTANRDEDFAEIHLIPKRFVDGLGPNLVTLQ